MKKYLGLWMLTGFLLSGCYYGPGWDHRHDDSERGYRHDDDRGEHHDGDREERHDDDHRDHWDRDSSDHRDDFH